jgi:uncharacterized protein (DUF1697 family)
MKTYVVLLRGVMPVGKNKVPMARLRELLATAGFKLIRTYIASGNVLLDSNLPEATIAKCVHEVIHTHIGPDLVVIVRTIAELRAALKKCPFANGSPNHVLIYFFAKPVPAHFLKEVLAPGGEEVVVSGREVYVHYPVDIGHSKLKLPKVAKEATARNINTITKLLEISEEHA